MKPIINLSRVKTHKQLIVGLWLALSGTSCGELIQIPAPTTELVRTSVFDSDATALSALTGTYVKLANATNFASGGIGSITMLMGAYSDELVSYASSSSGIYPFYFNNLSSENATISSIWASSFNIIYSANTVIEGVDVSQNVTPESKRQLKGEALFIRGFVHFYLSNLYGDIPYITSTDYRVNAKLSRAPIADVYQSIITDLLEAKSLLTVEYPTGTRVRPNKAAATALLARVYLYNSSWAEAERQATEVINNTSQYNLLDDVNSVFLANSEEAIWQLIPQYQYTNEGSLYILLAPPNYVTLRNSFVNTFDENDIRKTNWINSLSSSSGLTTWYYAFKYKEKTATATGKEYSMVLRLAEQYLIRAEARLKQEKLVGANSAASDINTIRTRADLPNTPATSKEDLMLAIERERNAELFGEWAHRFFDLKRWNKLGNELQSIKPGWKNDYEVLPIPRSEILANTNFNQNRGY
jgi:hypothetical protein